MYIPTIFCNFAAVMKRLGLIVLALLPWIGAIRMMAVEVSLSSEERKLYDLIMQYRAENNLPAIPLSPALTYVAQTHVRDLQSYPPQDDCNLHSWSDQGAWSAVCYTRNPTDDAKKAVWNKPRELTTYPGAGYEIAHWISSGATARSAIEGWKKSPDHNATMINLNMWSRVTWRAVGIGIYKDYAVVWFGEEEDAESIKEQVQEEKPEEPKTNEQTTALQAQNAALQQQMQDLEKQLQNLQKKQSQHTTPQVSKEREAEIEQLRKQIEAQQKETERLQKEIAKANEKAKKEAEKAQKKSQEPKVKEPKPQQPKKPKAPVDHSNSWLNRYFNRSGFSSLSYLSLGYTYSFMDGHHLVNASILDFRASLVGASLLNVEMAVSPFNKRFAYKPSIRIYIPVAPCLSLVPYGGAEIDASYVGQYLDKNYTYDETTDFYINAVGGVALNLTAAKHVPMEIKVEYRHPVLERTNGALHMKGIYLGAQIYFGSVFKKK